jgi:hypothetical protein
MYFLVMYAMNWVLYYGIEWTAFCRSLDTIERFSLAMHVCCNACSLYVALRAYEFSTDCTITVYCMYCMYSIFFRFYPRDVCRVQRIARTCVCLL